jgi:hypothetical protein
VIGPVVPQLLFLFLIRRSDVIKAERSDNTSQFVESDRQQILKYRVEENV